ncbi:MAG: PEP-CTERM sorting domain-containing protein, partial [Burkholderiaceae bacterium]|nr:PEP-CTERM sorting domain-containing protein [Burkholderiaceae bacterium]
ADTLYLSSTAIANSGLFDVQGNLNLNYYSGSQPSFTNTGTVQVATGKTLTLGSIALVNNGGTLNAAAGATINYGGGSAIFNNGTVFGGAGTHLVTNNASFFGSFTAQNLALQSGTFTGGDGVTPGSQAVLNGHVAFTGGQLTGNWQVAPGQTLTAKDGSSKFIANATLTNQGTLAWQSGDTAYLSSSTLINQGKVDLQSDALMQYYSGSQPAFVNSGLLVKSAGTGTSNLSTVVLSNTGTIEVQTGTIHLPDIFANAGALTGTGTLQSSALTNDGHVAPGSGIGTLTLAGNYQQSALGFLDTQLQNPTSSDLFLVSGNATLGGTLALRCFSNCSFAVGDEVVILDATGSLAGTFANVTLDGFKTGAFTVVYDLAGSRVLLDVTQAVTAAVPEPQTWALLLAGLGVVGFTARRRGGNRTPQAGFRRF